MQCTEKQLFQSASVPDRLMKAQHSSNSWSCTNYACNCSTLQQYLTLARDDVDKPKMCMAGEKERPVIVALIYKIRNIANEQSGFTRTQMYQLRGAIVPFVTECNAHEQHTRPTFAQATFLST